MSGMSHNFAVGDRVYGINDSRPSIVLELLAKNAYLIKMPNDMITSCNVMNLEKPGYDPILDVSNNPGEIRLRPGQVVNMAARKKNGNSR